MLLGTVVGAGVGGSRVVRSRLGEVEVHSTTLELEALHLLVGSLAGGGGLEVDVAEATRALHVLVGDDSGTVQLIALLEGLVQKVIIDAPAQVTNEKSSDLVLAAGLSLGLLGRGGRLVVGLALLGRLGSFLLLLFGVGSLRVVRVVGVLIVVIGIIRRL